MSLLRRDSDFNFDDAKVTDFLGSLDPVLCTARIEETEKTTNRRHVASQQKIDEYAVAERETRDERAEKG